jgi:NADH:ubiquinone oxidoreductase subunit F (NADH-binding)
VPVPDEVRIHPGPALLEGVGDGPSLRAHRARYGALPPLDLPALLHLVRRVGLRGRGGAAFPFATKLEAASHRRRPVVVVNLSEGEPASAKDSALALACPHLVLDGAVAAARALRARELHVVVTGERPFVLRSVRRAISERNDGLTVHEHEAAPRFVAGQARAVVELLSGRPNLPVTAWRPEAVEGLRGRPTLLSNAETWAHVGLLALRGEVAYRRPGTGREPGTTLVTVNGPLGGSAADLPPGVPEVREVAYGDRLRDLLPPAAHGAPVLVGGFHGSWATWPTAASARISVPGMAALGIPLGAGVLLAPGPGACPLELTSRITDFLAGQSAHRCGPCHHGLPALAEALRAVLHGTGSAERVAELAGLVRGRGACAHPDGTARLAGSLLTVLPHEVAAHGAGGCGALDRAAAS